MRILVLQLARFGDLYCSWPALRALKRTRPESEIDLVVRERFSQGAAGLNLGRVISFSTGEVLRQCTEEGTTPLDWSASLRRWTEAVRANEYDLVINMTYSPFSSYLANMVAGSCSQILGYHRYADGHLALSDEASAYFYAQVGVGKPNRRHLIRLFGDLLGVQPLEQDFAPEINYTSEDQIVVHLGASQESKRWPAERWIEALTLVRKEYPGKILLIGSADEKDLGFWVSQKVAGVEDLVGKTQLTELFEIVGRSRLFVGGDSAPLHISTLTGVAAVNLSFASVNFWETGPLTPGSRVLWAEEPQKLSAKPVAEEILALYRELPPKWARYYVTHERTYLDLLGASNSEDQQLLNFLYRKGSPPQKISPILGQVVQQLLEVVKIAIQGLQGIAKDQKDQTSQGLLSRADEIIDALGAYGPGAGVLVRWLQAERIRIPPGPFPLVLEKTFLTYSKFEKILNLVNQTTQKKGSRYGKAELEQFGFKE